MPTLYLRSQNGDLFSPEQNTMSLSFLPVQFHSAYVCGDNLYSVYVNIWGNDSGL